MSVFRRWQNARDSRAYEVACARVATWKHEELLARLQFSPTLGLPDCEELEAMIVRWVRAFEFNEAMHHWRWWHGPDRPYDMTWASRLVEHLDGSKY